MKVGQEISDLGFVELELDFTRQKRVRRWLRMAAQFVVIVGCVVVSSVFFVALSAAVSN